MLLSISVPIILQTDKFYKLVYHPPKDHTLSNTEEREPDCFLTKKKTQVIPLICAYTEKSNSRKICK